MGLDRNYYTTIKNDSVVNSIVEGTTIEVEAEPSGYKNTFNIKKIINTEQIDTSSLPPQPAATGRSAGSPKDAGARTTPASLPAPSVKEVLESSKALASKAFPDATADSLCHLTATLIEYQKGMLWFNKDFKS